ncbi:MAG: UbiD family decarboxylase domain-containing protein, partial [Candidatus Promineifilaceae bacterium]
MAYKDLSDFINQLESAGELRRITAPVSRDLEITEITDRISKMAPAENKALLFENVKGQTMPVVINLFGSEKRMAMALGVECLEDLHHNLAKLIDMKLPEGVGAAMGRASELLGALRAVGLKPSRTKKGVCQEVVHIEDASLNDLPVLQCWPDDGGRYITLMQVITRDPETNQRNVGMYRVQVYDDKT